MVADISTSTKICIVCIRKAGCLPEQNPDELEKTDDESDEKSDEGDCITDNNSPDPPHSKNAAHTHLTLSTGQWVLVKYDDLEFPGEVTSYSETEAEVGVMHKSGSAWRWPTNPDNNYYERANILREINPPKAAGHHGRFVFDDIV